MTYSGYTAYDAQMAKLEDQLRQFRGARAVRPTLRARLMRAGAKAPRGLRGLRLRLRLAA